MKDILEPRPIYLDDAVKTDNYKKQPSLAINNQFTTTEDLNISAPIIEDKITVPYANAAEKYPNIFKYAAPEPKYFSKEALSPAMRKYGFMDDNGDFYDPRTDTYLGAYTEEDIYNQMANNYVVSAKELIPEDMVIAGLHTIEDNYNTDMGALDYTKLMFNIQGATVDVNNAEYAYANDPSEVNLQRIQKAEAQLKNLSNQIPLNADYKWGFNTIRDTVAVGSSMYYMAKDTFGLINRHLENQTEPDIQLPTNTKYHNLNIIFNDINKLNEPNIVNLPSRLLSKGLRYITKHIPGVSEAETAAVMVGATAARPVLAPATMAFTHTYRQSYGTVARYGRINEIDPKAIKIGANLSGVLSGLLEAVGTAGIIEAGGASLGLKGASKVLDTKILGIFENLPAGQRILHFIKGVGEETSTEVAQEYVENFSKVLSSKINDLYKEDPKNKELDLYDLLSKIDLDVLMHEAYKDSNLVDTAVSTARGMAVLGAFGAGTRTGIDFYLNRDSDTTMNTADADSLAKKTISDATEKQAIKNKFKSAQQQSESVSNKADIAAPLNEKDLEDAKIPVEQYNDETADFFVELDTFFEGNQEVSHAVADLISARALATGITVNDFIKKYNLKFKDISKEEAAKLPEFTGKDLSNKTAATVIKQSDTIIYAFRKDATLNSIVHEIGHIFFEDLDNTEKAKLEEWAGVEPGNKWTTEQKEKFATAFEHYLKTNDAPTSKLVNAFETFKNYLISIYDSLKRNNITELPESVTKVFDDMLRQKEEKTRIDNDTAALKKEANILLESPVNSTIGRLYQNVLTTEEALPKIKEGAALEDLVAAKTVDALNKDNINTFEQLKQVVQDLRTSIPNEAKGNAKYDVDLAIDLSILKGIVGWLNERHDTLDDKEVEYITNQLYKDIGRVYRKAQVANILKQPGAIEKLSEMSDDKNFIEVLRKAHPDVINYLLSLKDKGTVDPTNPILQQLVKDGNYSIEDIIKIANNIPEETLLKLQQLKRTGRKRGKVELPKIFNKLSEEQRLYLTELQNKGWSDRDIKALMSRLKLKHADFIRVLASSNLGVKDILFNTDLETKAAKEEFWKKVAEGADKAIAAKNNRAVNYENLLKTAKVAENKLLQQLDTLVNDVVLKQPQYDNIRKFVEYINTNARQLKDEVVTNFKDAIKDLNLEDYTKEELQTILYSIYNAATEQYIREDLINNDIDTLLDTFSTAQKYANNLTVSLITLEVQRQLPIFEVADINTAYTKLLSTYKDLVYIQDDPDGNKYRRLSLINESENIISKAIREILPQDKLDIIFGTVSDADIKERERNQSLWERYIKRGTIGKTFIYAINDLLDSVSSFRDLAPDETGVSQSTLSKVFDFYRAENDTNTDIRKAKEKLHQLYMDVFNFNKEGQVWRKINADKKVDIEITLVEPKITSMKEGNTTIVPKADILYAKPVKRKFSISQLRYIYMLMQDPSMEHTLANSGILKEYATDDGIYSVYDEVENALSNEDKELAKGMMQLLAEAQKAYADRDIYGLGKFQARHYTKTKEGEILFAPARIIGDVRIHDNTSKKQPFSIDVSMMYQHQKDTIARDPKYNVSLEILGDFAVIDGYLNEVYHELNHVDLAMLTNNVLRDKRIKNAITYQYGKEAWRMINFAAKEVLGRGKFHSMKIGIIDKALDVLIQSQLGLSLGVGIKQMISIINYFPNMPMTSFVKYASTAFKGINDILDTDYMKNRGGNIDSDLRQMKQSEEYQKFVLSPGISNLTMIFVRWGDKLGFGVGANIYKQYLMDKGLSKEEAVEIALREGNTSQQSAFKSQKSYFQLQAAKNSLIRLLTMYSSGPVQAMRKELNAVKHAILLADAPKPEGMSEKAWRRNKAAAYNHLIKTVVIYHFAVPILYAWASTYMTGGDEQDYIDNAFISSILGPMAGIYNFGRYLRYAVAKLLGMQTYQQVGPITALQDKALRAAKKLTQGEFKQITPNELDGIINTILIMISQVSPTINQIPGLPIARLGKVIQGTNKLVQSEGKEGVRQTLYGVNQKE